MTALLDADDLRDSQDVLELAPAAERIAGLCPKIVVEIGAYTGASLRVWAQVAAEMALLIAVDTVPERVRSFARRGQQGMVIAGDSADPETVRRVKLVMVNRPVDFLFIDGDHTRPLEDFGLWAPLVRPGGIVGFHDITHGGEFWTRQAWAVICQHFPQTEIFINSARSEGEAMGIGFVTMPSNWNSEAGDRFSQGTHRWVMTRSTKEDDR